MLSNIEYLSTGVVLCTGIAELAEQIAHMGASIKDIFHGCAWIATDVFSVRAKTVVAGTRDRQHVAELEKVLRSKYDNVNSPFSIIISFSVLSHAYDF
ncbi:hypothetical protein ANCCAN_20816 [Ancylostoma caninum]|uniref:Uncharacterized protein n=1 Tax=Ancylostoma caninum TaxID=29170 RepID=A0A368FQR0_ANCCA|nr:hypothetical protein ANCCAN_20816 [Ancylostoma caninum]